MTVTPDLIAALVQEEYAKLPASCKPAVRSNGVHEWVPLSGIVAQGEHPDRPCLSTGMKCLPAAKLPQARGGVLHDWHAEVLALRAFNRFVLDECRALAEGSLASSKFLRRRTADEVGPAPPPGGDYGAWHGQPFAWREDVLLHMYCSEAPCGDASMELTMEAQADATPWPTSSSSSAPIPPSPCPSRIPPSPPSSGSSPSSFSSASPPNLDPSLAPDLDHVSLPGRAYFSRLGAVRRKPARGDAPPALAKSCSDKLALRQCASLLGAAAALLVAPDAAYLASLALPAAQHRPDACRRAWAADGRMAPLLLPLPPRQGAWPGGYAFRPFHVSPVPSSHEFVFSRRSVTARASRSSSSPSPSSSSSSSCPPATTNTTTTTTTNPPPSPRIAPSNLAVAWTAHGRREVTLGGVPRGSRRRPPPRDGCCCIGSGGGGGPGLGSSISMGSSSFCSRRAVWALAAEVASLLLLQLNQHQHQHHQQGQQRQGSSSSSRDDHVGEIHRVLTAAGATYGEVKGAAPQLSPRRRVRDEVRRDALPGWVRNAGDDDFVLL
ncbi:adenosine deaminase/editase [Xylariaceae sp. FL0804]|nr:adenosine deaminase/editase [Xylariaceae sp. FL0804]